MRQQKAEEELMGKLHKPSEGYCPQPSANAYNN